MWGAVLGAGVSLLGKLFGKDDDKPQETTTRINYKQMVQDAEAAGFNPLTALRAGGGAGFTTTTHPALTAYSPLGEGLQTIGSLLSSYDPQANERAKLEHDLLQAQLQNIQTDTRQRMRSFEVPVKTGSTAVDAFGNPIRSDAAQNGLGRMGTMTVGELSVTNPGYQDRVDPSVPDAQHSEDRYGEILGTIGGLYTGYKDFTYHMKKNKPFGDSKSNWQKAKDVWADPVPYMKKANDWIEQDLKKFAW